MTDSTPQRQPNPWTDRHVHFVTGRLAEYSLRCVLENIAPQIRFRYSIDVLGITVAALMTPAWIASRIRVPAEADCVLIPGYCEGDLAPVRAATGVPVERGPRDLRALAEYLGRPQPAGDYGGFDIEILAEINHAPSLRLPDLLAAAAALRADGADLIDVGCTPGETWSDVGDAVTALREAGHRVSIDTLNTAEIGPAVRAGAELVLSVNASNRHAARDWGCRVVVIPDDPATGAGLDETIEQLAVAGVPLMIDPVLSPIGFGFAASLRGYFECRRRYPDAEMMMGIGNLTELTEVDSPGLNVLLLGICQELGIRNVLTTQVINWARTSVRECDVARRLVFHAVRRQALPKHVDSRLVMLRDPKTPEFGREQLDRLAAAIKDNNYRILAEAGQVHVLARGLHLEGSDPFLLFEQLLDRRPTNVDPGHAFYLGFEMAKAAIALLLGKDYRQDEALRWGMLTVEEQSHRLKRVRSHDAERARPEHDDSTRPGALG